MPRKHPQRNNPSAEAAARVAAIVVPQAQDDVNAEKFVDGYPFTTRQKLFAEALCGPASGNATEAAALAGYSTDRRQNCRLCGHQNLQNPRVTAYIRELLAKKFQGPEWAETEMAALAGVSFTHFLTRKTPDSAPTMDWEKAEAHGAVASIKEIELDPETGGITKIKTYDRQDAIKTLLKIQGKLSESNKPTGPVQIIVNVHTMGEKSPPVEINATLTGEPHEQAEPPRIPGT